MSLVDELEQTGLVNLAALVEVEPGSAGHGVATLPPVPAEPPTRMEDTAPARAELKDAIAAPAVRRPAAAVRTAAFPRLLFQLRGGMATAGADILPEPLTVEADGLLEVSGYLASGAGYLTVSVDGGEFFGATNGGADETVGAWFGADAAHRVRVYRGDLVQLQVSAEVSFGVLRVGLVEGWY
jgi:hypothetical protein